MSGFSNSALTSAWANVPYIKSMGAERTTFLGRYASDALKVAGSLAVNGATTLSAATVTGTLGVTGASTLGACTINGTLVLANDYVLTSHVYSQLAHVEPGGGIYLDKVTGSLFFWGGNEDDSWCVFDNAGRASLRVGNCTNPADQDVYGLVRTGNNVLDDGVGGMSCGGNLIVGGSVTCTALTSALDTKLAKSGRTMTGALTLSGAPAEDLHAATKKYVDDHAGGTFAGGHVTGDAYADSNLFLNNFNFSSTHGIWSYYSWANPSETYGGVMMDSAWGSLYFKGGDSSNLWGVYDQNGAVGITVANTDLGAGTDPRVSTGWNTLDDGEGRMVAWNTVRMRVRTRAELLAEGGAAGDTCVYQTSGGEYHLTIHNGTGWTYEATTPTVVS